MNIRSGMLIVLIGIVVCAEAAPAQYEYVLEFGGRGTNDGEFVAGSRDVAIDGNDSVYAVDHRHRQVHVFASDGTFLSKWSTVEITDGQTNMIVPQGIAINEDLVYVTQMSGADSGIFVYTTQGEFVSRIVEHGEEEGHVLLPNGVIIDNASNLVVEDLGNDRIQVFDAEGAFQLAFGSSGTADDQFQGITGVAVNEDGNFYVSDLMGEAIKKFSAEGFFFARWDGSEGAFKHPYGLIVDSFGNVVVCDPWNHRIQILDSEGSSVAVITVEPGPDGEFEPVRIAMDSQGNLYVVDGNNARIVKFAPVLEPGEAPAVTDPTWANVTETTATLGGTVTDDGGATIIERGVYWSTTQGFDPETEGAKVSETGEFGEGVFTLPVANLPPDTTLHFRAFARHIATSGYSDEASFTTTTGSVIYVNSDIGDDAYDGYSPTVSGPSGPKATLDGAMAIAQGYVSEP